jgi:uncharacterized membrane protein
MSARGSQPPAAAPERRNATVARIDQLGAKGRVLIAFAIGLVAFAAEPGAVSSHTRLVVSWNAGTLAYLALAWTIIRFSDAESTRSHALAQDSSLLLISLFVLGAACASVVAIAFVVGTIKDLALWTKAWRLALTVIALTSSWVLIQTIFAFHYARDYYHEEKHSPAQAGGLAFPGDADPDFLDFAYYSFVVGMTSQVSDVQVRSHKMRRLTLAHGVLAFVFNIAVLALSINIIASAI